MKFITRNADNIYTFFRIAIGFYFFLFGIMKLFGLWGMPGGPASFGSLVWIAGAGEFLIGLALVFGVLTRLASLFGVIEMLIAYVLGHAMPNGWNPVTNMGAPAILFGLAFLVTLAYGAKKASLEKKLFKKEFF